MQTLEKIIDVAEDDLDQLNHVNNVRYVQWVQDIAEQHWLKNATENILENYFWVLVSHHIEYKSQAILGDRLKIKTYVSKSEGVTSTRHVEISNLNTGKIVTLSTTKWCFIDSKTKRPTRITVEVSKLFD